MLKQFCGSPINLTSQIGILSLANQDLAKGLLIEDIQPFLHFYLSVPVLALLFLPARLVGKCILSYMSSL